MATAGSEAQTGKHRLRAPSAVQSMVYGVAGQRGEEETEDDSTHVTAHVTAGNALAQLVRPRIRDLISPGARAQPSFTGRRIAVSEAGHLLVSPVAGGGAMQQLSPALLAELDGVLLVRKRREAGPLDGGVVLRCVRDGAWELFGWRCEGGQRRRQAECIY